MQIFRIEASPGNRHMFRGNLLITLASVLIFLRFLTESSVIPLSVQQGCHDVKDRLERLVFLRSLFYGCVRNVRLRWNGLLWSGLHWNGLRWNGLRWNGLRWHGLRWNGLR